MMNQRLDKFMKRLSANDNKDKNKSIALPEKLKVSDIENISFQTTPGSDEYIFNLWLKSHTGVPNRTTFKTRLKSIDQCLAIKKMIDDEHLCFDDIFADAEDEAITVATPIVKTQTDTVAPAVDTDEVVQTSTLQQMYKSASEPKPKASDSSLCDCGCGNEWDECENGI